MKTSKIIFLLLVSLPILSYASVFSSLGYGEYVDFGDAVERGMGGAKVFLTPDVHTFKVTFLADFIRITDKDNVRDDHEFSLYDIDYFLPLPNKFGMAISLTNVLTRNFYIESRDNQLGDIRYDRTVEGSGGVYITSATVYKSFHNISFGLGGIVSFGETQEIWETNFTSSEYDKTVEVIYDSLYGYGIKPQLRLNYEKIDISLGYSHYFDSAELPSQASISLFYKINPEWTAATNFDMEMWNSIDDDYSTGTNLGLGISNRMGRYTLRSGVFSRSWYYKDIHEMGGCLGISYLYPDRLGELSLGLEVGKRSWEDIEEMYTRLSLTLCGREIW